MSVLRTRMLVVAALAVSGCAAPSRPTAAAEAPVPPPEIVAAAPAPTCDQAAEHKAELFVGLERFQDASEARQASLATMLAVLKVEILKECVGMAWSEEARACAAQSSTLDAFEACHPPVDPARYPGADIAGTGIDECDVYVASFAKFASCPSLASDPVIQAQFLTARGGWSALADPRIAEPLRQSAASLCQQAGDGLPALGRAVGCK